MKSTLEQKNLITKTILIAEDDIEIRTIEKDYMIDAGYDVIEVGDGESIFDKLESHRIDLILLDLNLPKLDGIGVCKKIREDSSSSYFGVPIIIVTARTSEIDELIGLNTGADDYIKKPFSPKILVARVNSLLKKPKVNSSTLEHGDLMIDLDKRILYKLNKEVPLTTIQLNILITLMQEPGKVFRRYDLVDKSYDGEGESEIFDRTIDSHIKNIRKAIELQKNPLADNRKPKYILTVRGIGYKFNEK